MGNIISLVLLVVYIVVGLVVAQANDYFAGVDSLVEVLSAILAVLLWPLVLLGVDLQFGEETFEAPGGGEPSRGDRR